ncbi:MAG TPA: glycosyltransferase family 2 protein, partial [Gillisia sp.]|nr:glycosyltransferase family 2 protein [Gillisia sp.]
MKFTLIVCTYQRPGSLIRLLDSVEVQTLYPDQILIIDGSTDEKTREILQTQSYRNLEYNKVNEQDRGLTKQRNYGVNKVSHSSEIICFLDDDIVLTPAYFENLLNAY